MKSLQFSNKKGTIFDMVWISLSIFVFAVGAVVLLMFMDRFNDVIVDNGVPQGANETVTNALRFESRLPSIVDGIFLVLTIGLSLIAIILAFQVKNHPVFYFLSLLFLISIAVFNIFLFDAWDTISNNPIIQPYASQFDTVNFIMERLPFYIIILSFVVAIVQYGKSEQSL